jgi:ABC-type cobalamin/Fe3+-siderophores transport system ATPase subunit
MPKQQPALASLHACLPSKKRPFQQFDESFKFCFCYRMTLLLGPPSSGKTTLLLALAGKLDPSLKVRDKLIKAYEWRLFIQVFDNYERHQLLLKQVKGEITYNGYRLDEFVPRKSSAYISQNDAHIGEMTVKETLDFSSRCQGVGTRYGIN